MLFIKNKVKIGVQAVKSESPWHKMSFVSVPFINNEIWHPQTKVPLKKLWG